MPNNQTVSTPLALLIGLVIGVAVMAVIWFSTSRRPAPAEIPDQAGPQELAEAAADVLEVLDLGTVVVGIHDDVLHATARARGLSLVNGTRVEQRILDVVRQVRGGSPTQTLVWEQRKARGVPPSVIAIRVAALDDGLVFVLGEDRSAAARVEATRRDFTTNVSHELKTPIGAVSLLSEAVAEAADDPETVRRFAGRLQLEAARLSELVAQIIQLSRLQAHDPMLAAEAVSVDDVVHVAIDQSHIDAERKEVILTTTGDVGSQVRGDRSQLAIAVSNLVSNAISYSDTGARVVVSARRRPPRGENGGAGSMIEISVSDNGIGIVEEDLERIFERFYRVDYARSRANGGTGLGLSIVKHVATTHGGKVSVWSKVGSGSTFTMAIPEFQPGHEAASLDSAASPDSVTPSVSAHPAPVQR